MKEAGIDEDGKTTFYMMVEPVNHLIIEFLLVLCI